jgi:hypothetical protein
MPKPNFFEGAELSDREFLYIQARRLKALANKSVDVAQPAAPGTETETIQKAMRDVPQHERNLVGLALSGGGIRSAIFGLGVLQALAEMGLLKFVDYLSTVSGGGYIGSWFAAWVKREGCLDNVVRQLGPSRVSQSEAWRGFPGETDPPPVPVGQIKEAEPEPISHLREFSNYLSPRLSATSADSWTLMAIYLRNFLVNQLVFLPAVLFVLLIVRLITASITHGLPTNWTGTFLVGAVAIGSLLISLVLVTSGLRKMSDPQADASGEHTGSAWLAWTVGSAALSSLLITWILTPDLIRVDPIGANASDMLQDRLALWESVREFWDWLTGINLTKLEKYNAWNLVPFLMAFAVLHGVINAIIRFEMRRILCGCVSGAVEGALLYVLLYQLFWKHSHEPALIATCGPPLCMLTITLSNVAEVALLGTRATNLEREWRSRLHAWFLIVSVVWLACFGVSLYGTLAVFRFNGYVRAGLAAGWITTAVGGLLAAKGSKTAGATRGSLLEVASLIAPYSFLLGLLCVMSLLANTLIATEKNGAVRNAIAKSITPDETPPPAARGRAIVVRETKGAAGSPERIEIAEEKFVTAPLEAAIQEATYWYDVKNPDWNWLWGSLLVSLLISIGASLCVDVNEFSLNAMYANRLTRCFLGASRRKREGDLSGVPARNHGRLWSPNSMAGFDPHDDLELKLFRPGGPPSTPVDMANPDKEQNYWGPYPLINTALNLVAGERLAWQERRAESFLLSPLHCGAETLGYRDACEYAAGYGDNKTPLTLGRAVAISGAAASPNMGFHSSPAVAALMTVFNVRLGWWLPNPKFEGNPRLQDIWRSRGPWFLLKWLAIECCSQTNASRHYLNISDGGHFENLGVYELIRRRCRLIIVSDAGADPKFEFEDLGALVRKCRTDFGIDIEIDPRQLRPAATSKHGSSHCAIGTIRYDQIEPTAPVGTLVYLKPSLSGNEPSDVQVYGKHHADFPHETTLDQFFSESQFESYRALGYHCATETFQRTAAKMSGLLSPGGGDCSSEDLKVVLDQVQQSHDDLTDNLVYQLRNEWMPRAPQPDDSKLKMLDSLDPLQMEPANVAAFTSLCNDIYPDLDTTPTKYSPVASANTAIELGLASRMLRIMEDMWPTLHLQAHPMNAGWMNLFQRWGKTTLLRRCWPLLRSEHGRDFVQFCENEFPLKPEISNLIPVTDIDPSLWQQVCNEFAEEWPDESTTRHGLSHMNSQAWTYSPTFANPAVAPRNSRALWCITVSGNNASLLPRTDPLRENFIAGVIGLRALSPVEKLTAEEIRKVTPQQIEQVTAETVEKKAEFVEDCLYKVSDAGQQKLIVAKILPATAELDARRIYELVVWVRPGFRCHRIGRQLLELFFEELGEKRGSVTALRASLNPGGSFKLVVYYPKEQWADKRNNLAKRLWLSFFSFYGFRRPGRGLPHSERDEVLVWDSSMQT